MEIKRIQEVTISEKKILVRADFNVAIENGTVKEAFKIKACKETIDYLLKKKCKVAICSHLGRPDGQKKLEFSLEQIKDDIETNIGHKVVFVDDCVGEKVEARLSNLAEDEVLLLENVRFYEGEEKNELDFSKKLAENFDFFINDAFSVCHRDQSSVTGVAKILPSFAGFWLQKEINQMVRVKSNFEHPAVAIIGGSKIETKIPVIKAFENIYDHVLVGGKIANEAIDQKIQFSSKVVLPQDFSGDRLDIGKDTIAEFCEIIRNAKTIVWNGPMGKFEDEEYRAGTESVLEAILEGSAFVLMGGGETLQIIEERKIMDKITFVSTGGGAMLEYLSGNILPGIEILEK